MQTVFGMGNEEIEKNVKIARADFHKELLAFWLPEKDRDEGLRLKWPRTQLYLCIFVFLTLTSRGLSTFSIRVSSEHVSHSHRYECTFDTFGSDKHLLKPFLNIYLRVMWPTSNPQVGVNRKLKRLDKNGQKPQVM